MLLLGSRLIAHSPGRLSRVYCSSCRGYGEAADRRSRLESFAGKPVAAEHHSHQHLVCRSNGPSSLALVLAFSFTWPEAHRPRTDVQGRSPSYDDGQNLSVIVLEVSGEVHYAAVEPLEDADRHLPPPAPSSSSIFHTRTSCGLPGLAPEWWAADLERRGIRLRIAGVTPEVRDLLEGSDSQLETRCGTPSRGAAPGSVFVEVGGE